jgi:transposase InsO family protein
VGQEGLIIVTTRRRHTPEQVVRKLTEADRMLGEGRGVADVCRQLQISEQAPRWGFRRAYHDARGEGWVVNHKKVQRLWRQEGLRVPVRRRRKRVGVSTATAVTAAAPNQVWGVDFQFDSTTDGRTLKIVSILDEHTRECLGGLVEHSITADALIDELDRIAASRATQSVSLRQRTRVCVLGHGRLGRRTHRSGLHPTGQPWRNGYIESFNGRLRDE